MGTMENFVRFEVTNLCAVYCLLREGEVVYVGQSTNIHARISRHWQNMQRIRAGKKPYARNSIAPIFFDCAMVKYVAKDALDREEFALIQAYLPMHNKLLRRPLRAPEVDLTTITAVLELVRRKRGPVVVDGGFRKRSITRARYAA